MDEIDLDRIITNDEDPEGHHVLSGQKMDETKGFNTIDFWALLYYHIQ